ncbi:MAG: hypothetical protein GXP42_17765 [Chloroflexi bacterium]|nr:hypothetical protein [Chloroflexota bacterium]
MNDPRSLILDRVREALKRAYTPEAMDAIPAPPAPPPFTQPLADVFARALEAVQGRCHRFESPENARDFFLAEMARRGASRLLCWEPAALPIPDLAHALRARGIELVSAHSPGYERASTDRKAHLQELAQIGIGLTGVAAGLARTGSLVLHADRSRGRLASLLPTIHYAILYEDQIFPDLAAWLAAAGTAARIANSSNTVIITGPSRSADIGQTLTLGAHGPKEVIVLLIENRRHGRRPANGEENETIEP